MQNKLPADNYLINPELGLDNKIALVNTEFTRITDHFDKKADKGKRNFQFYENTKGF